MNDVYEIYKPFKNALRNTRLFNNLNVIWAYSQNIINGIKMPEDIQIPPGFNNVSKNEKMNNVPPGH